MANLHFSISHSLFLIHRDTLTWLFFLCVRHICKILALALTLYLSMNALLDEAWIDADIEALFEKDWVDIGIEALFLKIG